jgi:NDP-sugar pyrophosphorylase family protein
MTVKHIKEINAPTAIDIIIPAAGLGRRMKSYGPKPLIKIKHNLTILDNQLRLIKRALPATNIILVCGFEADLMMAKSPDHLIKIENEKYDITNVVRSIGMGLRACSRDVLIIYGDLVFNETCLQQINFNKSSTLVGDGIMTDSEVGCVVNRQNYIENFMYDLEPKWGQITFFKGRELRLLKRFCWEPANYNSFGFEAINNIISAGGKFRACTHPKVRIIDIDTSKDLERMKHIL